jgi:hypothetical protein
VRNNPHDKTHRIIIGCIVIASLALMATGCSSVPQGARLITSTVQGVKVKAWDAQSQSPEFFFGLIRDEYITLDTNAVNGVEMAKQTSYESQGFFKANRVQTSVSFGKTAVTQPSQSQQMPSIAGSNTVWQPALMPK